jgi:hypothetical protein
MSNDAERRDYLRIYTWVLVALVLVGESATLILTNKYFPQGMDEFAFVVWMVVVTSRPLNTTRLGLMFGGYLFLFGSLYTMLFSRLDPNGGTGERIPGLIILMAACVVGAIWAYRRHQQS